MKVTHQRSVKGETMAQTHEPVAVLGMGAIGRGMAASALRASMPTIVWNRTTMEATRDLRSSALRWPRPLPTRRGGPRSWSRW